MKCVSCNGEVASDQERCPYCNTINKVGIANNKRFAKKLLYNLKLKEHVLGTSKEYIWNKIMNRTIWIMAILFFVLLILDFIFYVIVGINAQPMKRADYTNVYDNFLTSRNECIVLIDRMEILKENSLGNALSYGFQVLDPDNYTHKTLTTEELKILKEQQQSVYAFFQAYLKLEKYEIDSLCDLHTSTYISSSDFEEEIETIKERLRE